MSEKSSEREEGDEAGPSTMDSDVQIPQRRTRNQFSIGEKLLVVEYAKTHSRHAASVHFRIARRCVQNWIKQEQQMRQLQQSGLSMKVRLPGQGRGRRVKTGDFEDALVEWLTEQGKKQRSLSFSRLRSKARQLAKKFDGMQKFVASTRWIEAFTARHNLTCHGQTVKLTMSACDGEDNPATAAIAVEQDNDDSDPDFVPGSYG